MKKALAALAAWAALAAAAQAQISRDFLTRAFVILYPDGDALVEGVTGSDCAPPKLFTCLNEMGASDSWYIRSSPSEPSAYRMSLTRGDLSLDVVVDKVEFHYYVRMDGERGTGASCMRFVVSGSGPPIFKSHCTSTREASVPNWDHVSVNYALDPTTGRPWDPGVFGERYWMGIDDAHAIPSQSGFVLGRAYVVVHYTAPRRERRKS